MEDLAVSIIISCVIMTIFFGMICLINIKWVMFGMNIMIKKFTKKGNIGLLLIRSKANNFNIPFVIDLGTKEHQCKIGGKNHIYPIERKQFEKAGRLFGLPYAMFNDDDCKTSLGLVYHVSDAKGVPLYHDEAEQEPKYSEVKNSVSLSGGFLQALVDEKVFSDGMKAFLDKNQMVIYLCIGAIAAGGAGAYFGYELTATTIPNIEIAVNNAVSSINNKLDLILAAVQ